ncbi:putative uncharacterized protein [Cryptobacterium sp. CAG:338]|nr:putative uncharacterized protein [Cryptobacterium sp. CAG:338]
MFSSVEKEKYDRKLNLRLTYAQFLAYKKAALLKGQTLTQWSVAHLDEAARYDIEQAKLTRLSERGFDLFCQALDSPMPKSVQDLFARDEIWG